MVNIGTFAAILSFHYNKSWKIAKKEMISTETSTKIRQRNSGE